MAEGQLQSVLRHLRKFAAAPADRDLSDSELLERFTERHEESAFTLLVQRHGPMVLSLCRRILRNPHDADDAFQATFLVLARKSAAVRKRVSLASWLYGVAWRVAVRAKAQAACRRGHEGRAGSMARAEPIDPTTWDELRLILDEEIGNLPEMYRTPLVVCCLEGKTQARAAAELGLSKSAIGGRLERARELLRERLARRGVVLSAGLLAAALGGPAAPAAVPALLTLAAVRAAALTAAGRAAGAVSVQVLSLSEGVLQAMTVSKVKVFGAALLLAGALGAGTGEFGVRIPSAVGAPPATAEGAPQQAGGQTPTPTGARPEGQNAQGTAQAEKLLKSLDEILQKKDRTTAENERLLAAARKLLEDAQRKEIERQRLAALKAISQGIEDLKKTVPSGSREQHALEEFIRSYRTLYDQMVTTNTAKMIDLDGATIGGLIATDVNQLAQQMQVLGFFTNTVSQPNQHPVLQQQASTTVPPLVSPARQPPQQQPGPSVSVPPMTSAASATSAATGSGVVREITPEGLILVTLDGGHQVQSGQTLEVVRFKPSPMYLGRVRILAVAKEGAVAVLTGPRMQVAIQAGDLVLPRIASSAQPGPQTNPNSGGR